MVEQENSQASPVFPGSQDSNAKLQDAFYNPWFMIDSTALLNEKALSSSDVVVEGSYPPYMLQDILPKNVHDSNLEKSSKAKTVTRLDEWSQSMSEMFPATSDAYFEVNSPLSFWGTCPLDLDTMKIDEVFQVDKDELFQSPTLAELNANDESLFDSFDCFDGFVPNGNKAFNKQLSMSDLNPYFNVSVFNNADHPKHIVSYSESSELMKEQAAFLPKEEPSCEKLLNRQNSEETSTKTKQQSSLHDKLQTVPTSADDPKKNKRSFRQQQSVDSKEKDTLLGETSVETCVETLHNQPCSSYNDNSDSEDDSEMDAEYSTDADEFSEDETKLFSSKHASVNKGSQDKKRSRYFWQYNIQSKGPKGPKLKLTGKPQDVHDVKGVGDPIFSTDCPIDGVKHSGKARRGDGNDLTPNPKKLHNIGRELDKLNHIIDGLVPVNELPVNARTKSRKEKNKLASRACRLKKKAQHEANKLKLYGLQEEQKLLLMLTKEAKKLIRGRVLNSKQSKPQSIVAALESMQMKKDATKVAGCSADFVNNVLQHVASGDESGGLNVTPVHEN